MSEPSIIYEDNKACISISEGDTDKKRTKHIAKHFHSRSPKLDRVNGPYFALGPLPRARSH